MTPHQAICHLSDSFRVMMNPESISSVSTILSRTVIKWVALRAPMQWPHGTKTRPEVDQEIGGTRPVDFVSDRCRLEALIEQFARRMSSDMQPHPMFGRMSTDEWHRWGYLHLDHHLASSAYECDRTCGRRVRGRHEHSRRDEHDSHSQVESLVCRQFCKAQER
jgi:hypothetical protein